MHEFKDVFPAQQTLLQLGYQLGKSLLKHLPHKEAHQGATPHMIFISVLDGVQSAIKIEQQCFYAS